MLISKFDLYKREWLDLVFADRNKSYGAYDLRKHYADNMLKALAITVVGFTVAFVTISLVTKHDIVKEIPPLEQKTDVYIKPPVVEPPVEAKVKPKTEPLPKTQSKPAAAPAQEVAMTRSVPPVITTAPVTTEPASQTDLLKTAIGPKTIEGPANGPENVLTADKGPGSGGAVDGDGTGSVIHNVGTLDMLPEPVGGTGAWSRFLQKNLRYPQTEAQGRVILSFVVEKDGHLTDIKVERSISPELDREALRVLKLAPAWKPGIQNGQPVRVKFTVPIVFQMTEQ